MFHNHIKIAFRRLAKHKSFSLLNIMGLAVGVACSSLILLWAQDELSFDRFHEKADRIFQVMTNQHFNDKIYTFGSTPGLLAGALKDELPEIAQAARASWPTDYAFSLGEKSSYESGYMVDSSFFDILSFPLVAGDAKTALRETNSLVITERMAERFFGMENALGKTLKVNNQDEFKVTGVMKNPPSTSSLYFEWLAPFRIFEQANPWWNTWGNNGMQTFVLLNTAADSAAVNSKIRGFVQAKESGAAARPVLFPLHDWHLRNEYKDGQQTGRGRIEYVQLFGIIAAFIMLIACFNYMNLTTARSENRRKEVGVRKVVGAGRGSLAGQFMGEAMLVSLMACALAVVLLKLAIPPFNALVDKELALELTNPLHLGGLLTVALVSGLLAGIYPSLYLSAFKPIAVLKGKNAGDGGAASLRKGLVVAQFCVSVFLIFCTIVVYKQLNHVKSRHLGYDKAGLIYVGNSEQINRNFTAIQQQALASGMVQQVAKSNDPVLNIGSNTSGFKWEGKPADSDKLIGMTWVSPDYIKTLGMKLKSGRDFHENPDLDSNSIIINEAFAKIIQQDSKKEDLVGQTIRSDESVMTIVGVLEDFRYGSMYNDIEPLMLFCTRPDDGVVWFKLNPDKPVAEAVAAVGDLMKAHNPGFPFNYQFLDEEFDKMFRSEATMGKLSLMFSTLAIFICCLGLFGLSAFAAERRTKEIGVRKVLGANVLGIIGLLSKGFVSLVVLSLVIATPLAWWAANKWLENYAYHIEIEWWVFALSGLLAVAIAFLTVGFQSIKAALVNPVESLRSE